MTELGLVGIVDKGTYDPAQTYRKGHFVLYRNSSWLAVQDNLQGVEPSESSSSAWKYLARGFQGAALADIQAVDASGMIDTVGSNVNSQTLIDAIADRVMTKLLAKTQVVNNLTTATTGYVLDASQGKVLQDALKDYQTKTYGPVNGMTIVATKVGKFVNVAVTGNITDIAAGADLTLTTIDAVYRPKYYMGWNTYVTQSNAKINFLFRIDVNGNVVIAATGGALSGYVNFRYSYGI